MTKILLVEDDKSLREIYGVRLQAEGYEIVAAGDGEEALALSIKERPALILSDVMMPKISGFDMLDILRSTTETRDIKVIMMTALSSEDQRERGEKLGADRYLVKSQVGIEDVVRTVHEVLGDLPTMTQPAGAPLGTPAPAPTPTPVAEQPADTADAPVTLPQPTAPFSSPIPRPTGLGDRVIQPIHADDQQKVDMSAMINQELNATTPPTIPLGSDTATAPLAPVFPMPASTPIASQPADDTTVAQQTAPSQSIPPVPPQPPVIPAADPADTNVTRPDVASLSPQPAQPEPITPVPQPPADATAPVTNPVAPQNTVAMSGLPSQPGVPQADPSQSTPPPTA